MEKYVDFEEDVVGKYFTLMKGSYEKANIWPIRDAEFGMWVIDEEIEEAKADVMELWHYCEDFVEGDKVPSEQDCQQMIGYAVSAILELLQVICSNNKYIPVFNNTPVDEEA